MVQSPLEHIGYPTLEKIYELVDAIDRRTNHCTSFIAGRTAQETPIKALICGSQVGLGIRQVSDGFNEEEDKYYSYPVAVEAFKSGYLRGKKPPFIKTVVAKPTVLLTGLHHPREVLSSLAVLKFIENYVDCDSVHCRSLKMHVDVIALPVLNPDGLRKIDQTGNFNLRKNQRVVCESDFPDQGVDLNRNYAYKFDNESHACDSEEYAGPHAFSEGETQTVKRLTEIYPIVSALNFHTFGDVWTYPYNCCADEELDEHSKKAYTSFRQRLGNETLFAPAPKNPVLGYETSGEADDWLLHEKGIISMSPELGPEDLGFWPSYQLLENISNTALGPIYEVLNRTAQYSFAVSRTHDTIDLHYLTWLRICSDETPSLFCLKEGPKNINVSWMPHEAQKRHTVLYEDWSPESFETIHIKYSSNWSDDKGRMCLRTEGLNEGRIHLCTEILELKNVSLTDRHFFYPVNPKRFRNNTYLIDQAMLPKMPLPKWDVGGEADFRLIVTGFLLIGVVAPFLLTLWILKKCRDQRFIQHYIWTVKNTLSKFNISITPRIVSINS